MLTHVTCGRPPLVKSEDLNRVAGKQVKQHTSFGWVFAQMKREISLVEGPKNVISEQQHRYHRLGPVGWAGVVGPLVEDNNWFRFGSFGSSSELVH